MRRKLLIEESIYDWMMLRLSTEHELLRDVDVAVLPCWQESNQLPMFDGISLLPIVQVREIRSSATCVDVGYINDCSGLIEGYESNHFEYLGKRKENKDSSFQDKVITMGILTEKASEHWEEVLSLLSNILNKLKEQVDEVSCKECDLTNDITEQANLLKLNYGKILFSDRLEYAVLNSSSDNEENEVAYYGHRKMPIMVYQIKNKTMDHFKENVRYLANYIKKSDGTLLGIYALMSNKFKHAIVKYINNKVSVTFNATKDSFEVSCFDLSNVKKNAWDVRNCTCIEEILRFQDDIAKAEDLGIDLKGATFILNKLSLEVQYKNEKITFDVMCKCASLSYLPILKLLNCCWNEEKTTFEQCKKLNELFNKVEQQFSVINSSIC